MLVYPSLKVLITKDSMNSVMNPQINLTKVLTNLPASVVVEVVAVVVVSLVQWTGPVSI